MDAHGTLSGALASLGPTRGPRNQDQLTSVTNSGNEAPASTSERPSVTSGSAPRLPGVQDPCAASAVAVCHLPPYLGWDCRILPYLFLLLYSVHGQTLAFRVGSSLNYLRCSVNSTVSHDTPSLPPKMRTACHHANDTLYPDVRCPQGPASLLGEAKPCLGGTLGCPLAPPLCAAYAQPQ